MPDSPFSLRSQEHFDRAMGALQTGHLEEAATSLGEVICNGTDRDRQLGFEVLGAIEAMDDRPTTCRVEVDSRG